MTVKEFLKSIFLAKTGTISSKRICGVLGWLVCIGISIYCTIKVIQAPVVLNSIIIGSVALLGVDSIIRPFGKNKQNSEEDQNEC